MPAADRVVIIGAGQGGLQVADSLRSGGFAGGITVVGEENVLPYQRPPLSKDHLRPGGEPAPLPIRAAGHFAGVGIDVRIGARAAEIDRARCEVVLDSGCVLPYSRLVLATGAANRALRVAGAGLDGIHHLRTLDEARAVRADLERARTAVVVGAGFIGLEFAAAARKRGLDVTVLEAADRPMARVLSAPMADFVANAHLRAGVDLRVGEGVASFEGRDGRVSAVTSALDGRYPADLVLVGVGVTPRTDLAERAGLAVDDGVLVDDSLRTSDERIHAIGDCARFPSHHLGARTRLESVQNATDQARHVARTVLDGPAPYRDVPWFWSDQGDLRLQIAGLGLPGDDEVLRGDVGAGKFSVFRFRGGELAAVESANRPADHLAARRLLAADSPLRPEQAADPAFDLKAHAKRVPLRARTAR
ncbi:FAD-dependent oxidoreductase [Saccharopolyspora indica]|uniref:NAD(P)/FAD-dependent oxidoreductase n=1 Tax=Saccharopolyspora indica TaxID=1229659 RepID=UPI0022EB3FF8|nr:FAD-dependent oxidoreductase [Saccharopolyspora indica]MDA3644042.1 FAD-dependent oxidoreductase [Saccharopolyspora indica]